MKITNRNEDERKTVEGLQLRMRGIIPPHLWSDRTLFQRFLRARDFDLVKAEIMLKRHIVWRQVNQIDTFLENFRPKEFFLKHIEPSILGYAKDGEMFKYVPVGKIDMDETMKCTTMSDYMKCWVWSIENCLKIMKEHSEKTGKNCSQMSFIFDLDQLTFKNASNTSSIDLFMRLIYLFQDNYPERLKSVYIVNAPNYYMIVYSAVKVAMSAAMVKKIHVFGRTNYQEKLLEVLDADLLPAFLGGTRTDPDGNPRCESFISHGGTIPDIYYLSNEERYFKDSSQVKTLVLPRSAKEEVIVDVADRGSIIHWEFHIKSKEIKFGLYQEVSDEGVAEILPMEIYSTPDGKESGSYKCHTAGRYILTFENSESWLYSRVVEYCVNVQNSC